MNTNLLPYGWELPSDCQYLMPHTIITNIIIDDEDRYDFLVTIQYIANKSTGSELISILQLTEWRHNKKLMFVDRPVNYVINCASLIANVVDCGDVNTPKGHYNEPTTLDAAISAYRDIITKYVNDDANYNSVITLKDKEVLLNKFLEAGNTIRDITAFRFKQYFDNSIDTINLSTL